MLGVDRRPPPPPVGASLVGARYLGAGGSDSTRPALPGFQPGLDRPDGGGGLRGHLRARGGDILVTLILSGASIGDARAAKPQVSDTPG